MHRPPPHLRRPPPLPGSLLKVGRAGDRRGSPDRSSSEEDGGEEPQRKHRPPSWNDSWHDSSNQQPRRASGSSSSSLSSSPDDVRGIEDSPGSPADLGGWRENPDDRKLRLHSGRDHSTPNPSNTRSFPDEGTSFSRRDFEDPARGADPNDSTYGRGPGRPPNAQQETDRRKHDISGGGSPVTVSSHGSSNEDLTQTPNSNNYMSSSTNIGLGGPRPYPPTDTPPIPRSGFDEDPDPRTEPLLPGGPAYAVTK